MSIIKGDIMNDFEIDKLFKNIDASISSALEDKILCASSKTFIRSYKIRKTVQRSISTLAIIIVCFIAFMAGQFSERQKVDGPKYANMNNKDMVTITVHKDFLAWVDAGNFFTQIEMKDKANEAFVKAISLVSKEQLNNITQNNQTEEKPFYSSLSNTESQRFYTMAMVNSISN